MRTIVTVALIALMIGSIWYALLGWVNGMNSPLGDQGMQALAVGGLGSLIAIGGLGVLVVTGRK